MHGTTQSPAGWQRLAEVLTRRGHHVHLVDLTADLPGMLAADYAELAASRLTGPPEQPVVVAHSGGCRMLPAIGRRTGASRLVWLAGYIPDPGRAAEPGRGDQQFAGWPFVRTRTNVLSHPSECRWPA